jgi:hypothetical protein
MPRSNGCSRRLAAYLGALSAAVALGGAAVAQDAPPAPAPAPAAAPGAVYKNPKLGLTVEGPSGWKLAEVSAGLPQWTTLATFSDAASGSSVVLSVRRATAVTLTRLRAEVTKTFAEDKTYNVAAVTDLAVSGRRPLPGVLVDATQPRPVETPAPAAGAAPPPAGPPPMITWRVQAAYLLGGDWEFQVLAQAKATGFARVAPAIDKMMNSVTVKVAGSAFSQKGDGTFRDDVAGFSVRYPQGYGVRVPDRTQHLAEFAPAGDGPVLGVYRYETDADLDHEASLLVEYYKGPEVGGEAESGRTQVAGREAAFVRGKGVVGGREQVFFVAVVKRGNDTFRLRCAADATQEAAARATFDAFAQSFVMTNPAGN